MKYERCLVELDEILNHMNQEELKKIPEEIINGIKEKKEKGYSWYYDNTKDFCNQNISRETIAMLSYINMNYLLDDKQKKLMEEIHKVNEDKQEKMKLKQYNPNDLFKNRKLRKEKGKGKENYKKEIFPTVVEEKRFYKKIFQFLRNILYINKKRKG